MYEVSCIFLLKSWVDLIYSLSLPQQLIRTLEKTMALLFCVVTRTTKRQLVRLIRRKPSPMKTTLTTLFVVIVSLTSNAQFIQQLTVIPANPSVNDQVVVIVDAGFPSGSCDASSQMGSFMNPHRYEASSMHCLGPLSFICYDADTFMLGQLPAGNFTFLVTVDAGILPSPCTPGIVPGPVDSVSFVVASASGLNENNFASFRVAPNPVSGMLSIIPDSLISDGVFIVYDIEGREIIRIVSAADLTFDSEALAAGNYYLRLLSNDAYSQAVKFVKTP